MGNLFQYVILILIGLGSIGEHARPAAVDVAVPMSVVPIVETDPVPHSADAADDPAIWIHPSDPALSMIIGTDKRGGLGVYDLAGRQIQFIRNVSPENVDVRYNVPLGGRQVDLVTTSDKRYHNISVYEVNPDTRQLASVAARRILAGISVYGSCMYRSPFTGKYYTFITKSPYSGVDTGEIQQWELFDNGSGKIDAIKVRTFEVGSNTEGCVADDVSGNLYVAETKKGIWKYGAEPAAGNERMAVDLRGAGRITGELEGVSLYYADAQTGYLIASHQGSREYLVYEREGANAYVATFNIIANTELGIDAATNTDGLDVTNVNLGPAFPEGLFVAQDNPNWITNTTTITNTNFKLVPWQSIANAAPSPLTISTSWNPRQVGDPSTPIPSPTPAPTSTPTETPSGEALPVIDSPVEQTHFVVGASLLLQGHATNQRGEPLPDSALTWEAIWHSGDQSRTVLPATSGNNIPLQGFPLNRLDECVNGYLEVRLVATDANGKSATVSRALKPRQVQVGFATQPTGLRLIIEGGEQTAPLSFVSCEGYELSVEAPARQDAAGQTYTFKSWSHSQPAAHTIVTPADDATYTATFAPSAAPEQETRLYFPGIGY